MIIAPLGKPRGGKSFRRLPGASTTGICRLGGPDGIRPGLGLVSDRGDRGLNLRKQAFCETVRVEGKAGGLALAPSVF